MHNRHVRQDHRLFCDISEICMQYKTNFKPIGTSPRGGLQIVATSLVSAKCCISRCKAFCNMHILARVFANCSIATYGNKQVTLQWLQTFRNLEPLKLVETKAVLSSDVFEITACIRLLLVSNMCCNMWPLWQPKHHRQLQQPHQHFALFIPRMPSARRLARE